jgi:acyl carrier protein
MNQQEILAQLTGIFRQLFGDDKITLTSNTMAEDIEGWDSFMHISLIVAVEAAFHIKFKTAETEELKNIGDFVKLIQDKITAAKA